MVDGIRAVGSRCDSAAASTAGGTAVGPVVASAESPTAATRAGSALQGAVVVVRGSLGSPVNSAAVDRTRGWVSRAGGSMVAGRGDIGHSKSIR